MTPDERSTVVAARQAGEGPAPGPAPDGRYGGLSPEEYRLARKRVARTLVRFWLRLLREQPGAQPDQPVA